MSTQALEIAAREFPEEKRPLGLEGFSPEVLKEMFRGNQFLWGLDKEETNAILS